MKFTNKFIFFVLLAGIILSFILYRDSFGSYFFQDDWFSLKISQAKGISDIVSFFIPRTDVIYYKPIGMQIPFFILENLFGINSLPFHMLTFATHIINIIGVFLLIKLLTQRGDVALLSSFLYAVSAIHFTHFFWPAAYSFIAGPAAFIYSFYFFLRYLKAKKNNYYFISIFIFLLGLFTNEMVFTLPIIIFLYLFIFDKKIFWKLTIPYFLVSFLILFARFALFTPPISGSYQWSIGKHILLNLEAYFLWSLNLPEEIKAQFVSLGRLNPQFINDFYKYYLIFVITFFVNLLFFILLPLIGLYKKKNPAIFKNSIFGISWFLAGLLPVIFFPKHSFTYFLSIPFIGLIFFMSSLFSILIGEASKFKRVSAVLTLVLVLSWIIGSATTINFNELIYWAPRRAKISQYLINQVKLKYPHYPDKGIVYVDANSENKIALNDQDAFQVIYNNPLIKTLYTHSPPPNAYLAR